MTSRLVHPTTTTLASTSLRRVARSAYAECNMLRQQQRFKSSVRPEQKSFFDSTLDFWSNLRRQAATALTSTLSPEEQQEMLQKLGASSTPEETPVKNQKKDDGDDAMNVQKTIAEAVAEARLQEAASHDQKWREEKERILAEAEKAARERVESELRVQKFQQWQQAVDQAKQEQDQEQQQQKEEVVEVAPAPSLNEEAEQQEHPLLGKALVDLGYKRVHLVSAKDLQTIQVWKKQRIYRHNRAQTMAQDKLKTLHLGMPGVISLHENQEGKLSIIDGQHRVGMMSILAEKEGVDGFDLGQVLVEVYPEMPEHGDDHAKDLFLEVNKAEPVKLVDMPGVATVKDRKVITDAAEKLHKSFPDMFSASQKCRSPNVNIDNLRDALFAGNVIKRHNLTTASGLEAWLLAQNESMAKKYEDPEAQESVPKAALKKANKFRFFLGLDSSWYYN